MQTFFGASCKQMACPLPPTSTCLMIIEGWTTLPCIKHQTSLCNHFLKQFMSCHIKNPTDYRFINVVDCLEHDMLASGAAFMI